MPRGGYSGHQFSDALERPFLHLFLLSRRPRWENDCRGAYMAALLALSSSLTVVSTVADSRGLDRRRHRPDLEVATAMEHTPSDTGDFVGERNRQLETIESPGCRLDPGFEAMLLPALRAEENGTGCLDEQHPQVAIAAFGDGPEDRAPARRHLSRHETEPSTEISALGEHVAPADRGDCCSRDDRANARHRHEALGSVILLGQRLDLVRHGLDAPIEMAPVGAEILDHVDHAGRQLVRHREDNGYLGAQRPQPLAHRNAALE